MPKPDAQPDSTPAPTDGDSSAMEGIVLSALAQRIVDSLQEGIIAMDDRLRCRFWNPMAEKIIGLPASETLGRRVPEVHSLFKDHGIDRSLERALNGTAVTIPDFAFSQKRTNWTGLLAGQVAPLRDGMGKVQGVVLVLHDVTRRKRMEEASLSTLQQYRDLFDHHPQPMWVHDVETLAILAVNEAAIRHYGFNREEFLFMTLNDLLAPAETEGKTVETAEPAPSAASGRPWRHKTKDGRVIEVEVNTNVVTFARRRAVLVVANDVTERRQAEQRLRESEAKYRALIESADVAIFLSEADTGRILEANRRSEQLLGLPRHRIIGLTLTDLVPPELAASRPGSTPGESGTSSSFQAFVWHRAGRRIPVDIIRSTLEIGGRRVVQSIYRDVTARKRAEDALLRRNTQLEVLSKASRQIHAVLEHSAILRETVSAALELVGATGGMAGVVVGGKIAVKEYCLRGRCSPWSRQFAPGQGVMGYVMASRLSYCSNEPMRDPLVLPEMQRDFSLRNLVCVPILNRSGELLGCLEVHNTRNDQPIEPEDLSVLEMLGSVAAVALENVNAIEARAQMQSRLSRLAESVVDVIWSIDAQLRFTDLTPSSQQLFGYAPEELLGESVLKLIAPESAETIKAAIGRGLNKPHLSDPAQWPRAMEIEQVRKDGSRFWVEAKVRPVFDASGNWRGFTGISRDITERKRAEATLARTAALNAATLESVPDGILVVDREGRMTAFNQRFVRMWKIPPALATARDDEKTLAFVLAQLKQPAKFLRKVKELYSNPEAEGHDLLHFKDGRVFERFSYPQWVDGQVVGRVWCFRDITTQYKARAARAERRAHAKRKRQGR